MPTRLGTVGIVYQYTGQVTGQAHILLPSKLDNAVPFSPMPSGFTSPFFCLSHLGIFSVPKKSAPTYVCHATLCAGFWGCLFVLPTTMLYHDYDLSTLSGLALSALMNIDSPQNLLPSLHVSLTLVVLNALWSTQQKFRTVLAVIWALAICASVLVLKRHLFIDVVTGALTACGALVIVHTAKFVLKRNTNE
ncbi:phosphatase PAP2 family protein [Providencia rettgeri]|nr:phosphatase PAP2 family protein [Providencia rettgeri]